MTGVFLLSPLNCLRLIVTGPGIVVVNTKVLETGGDCCCCCQYLFVVLLLLSVLKC